MHSSNGPMQLQAQTLMGVQLAGTMGIGGIVLDTTGEVTLSFSVPVGLCTVNKADWPSRSSLS